MALISPIGRVSYPSVFVPSKIDETNENENEKYRITLLVPKNDPGIAEMKAEATKAAMTFFNNKPPASMRSPFIDGDTVDNPKPEYAGMYLLRFSCKPNRPPNVKRVAGGGMANITEASGEMYAGCYARVSYSCYGYDYLGNKGVAFGLGNILKTGEGEPLDGRTSAEDDFASFVSDSPAETNNVPGFI